MSTTPALRSYQRVITTKRTGRCHTCDTQVLTGSGFAAVTADKVWHAYCPPCAASYAAQAAGLVRRLEAAAEAAEADGLDISLLALPDDARLVAVLQDSGSSFGYDVVTQLHAALAELDRLARAATPDPIADGLREVAADPNATDRDRGFAASLVRWLDTRGPLTEGQLRAATTMLAKRSNGSKVGAGPSTPGVYVGAAGLIVKVVKSRQSGRLYGKVWTGHGWDYQPHAANDSSLRPITAAEAAAFGHQHDHCVFCGLTLTDDGEGRSVMVGYGPICAGKYGLPWGA